MHGDQEFMYKNNYTQVQETVSTSMFFAPGGEKQKEDLSVPPRLDIKTCVSLLVSSEFLQMQTLMDECL